MAEALSRERIRRIYDRIGPRLDLHGRYENPALDELARMGRFSDAGSVFEFGCGTGRFAEKLLREYLPPEADYLGVDMSPVMVETARERLLNWSGRARVRLTDGSTELALPRGGFDRFVATYVFDLLNAEDSAHLVSTAARALAAGGLLCVASLTGGKGPVSGLVTRVWRGVFSIRPSLVGGCRPVEVGPMLGRGWSVRFRDVVTSWGVASEVLVAEKG